jgi:hypothetical protein
MARLVYAKDNQIFVSEKNIPTNQDTAVVADVEALKEYKLIYEAEGSKEGARIVLGSKTGIPAADDAAIYGVKTESKDETETPDPVNVEPETPVVEEPVVEDENVEGEE